MRSALEAKPWSPSDWVRTAGFAVRRHVPWSLPAWKRRATLAQVRDSLAPQGRTRLATLGQRYDLAPWAHCCSLQDWRESLYVLDIVSQYGDDELPKGRGLDIGSKNGCYLPGLATAHRIGWDAVELDAHRRYAWGSTRRVYGEAMAAHFENCRFWCSDVQAVPGQWALITWFLPFLFSEPLKAWGLPLRFLAPRALLQHAVSRLLPGGAMLIINQGEAEAEAQWAMLSEIPGIRIRVLGKVHSELGVFTRPRWGFWIRTQPEGTFLRQ